MSTATPPAPRTIPADHPTTHTQTPGHGAHTPRTGCGFAIINTLPNRGLPPGHRVVPTNPTCRQCCHTG